MANPPGLPGDGGAGHQTRRRHQNRRTGFDFAAGTRQTHPYRERAVHATGVPAAESVDVVAEHSLRAGIHHVLELGEELLADVRCPSERDGSAEVADHPGGQHFAFALAGPGAVRQPDLGSVPGAAHRQQVGRSAHRGRATHGGRRGVPGGLHLAARRYDLPAPGAGRDGRGGVGPAVPGLRRPGL